MSIIGRTAELTKLQAALESDKSEFITVYGRRRVGKTFLISEFFKNTNCDYLHITGEYKGNQKTQLENFTDSISRTFYNGLSVNPFKTWKNAFEHINELIEKSDPNKKFVIFLDELPWLATSRSNLLSKLEYFWNHFWSTQKKVILVVCGSSASWLIKNILNQKGGLHNRTTLLLNVKPFQLSETMAYINAKGLKLNKHEVLKIYMATGGIPYYLEYLKKGFSAVQNIQSLYFEETSPLKDEFKRLFSSLFKNYKIYMDLIELLAAKPNGLSRAQIEKHSTKFSDGGRLTERLSDLVAADFIESFTPFAKRQGEYFKIKDEFCIFYLKWVKPLNKTKVTADYWYAAAKTPGFIAWAGLAFEAVCLKHHKQLAVALKLPSGCTISGWRKVASSTAPGAQIDLLFDRPDGVISICEIKYTEKKFAITKSYQQSLMQKMQIFSKESKTDKQLFLVLICSSGLKENSYSGIASSVVELDSLFTEVV